MVPQMQKKFSIKTKGFVEILRHQRPEKHLGGDQMWRYGHLKTVDPVSGKNQHRVRGRNGKILTKIELAKKLLKFIHAELVDIGERFPFYEDFIKRTTTALVTPESRFRTQLCLVGDFIQTHEDLLVLRKLWSRVGPTIHQDTFFDFDCPCHASCLSCLSEMRLCPVQDVLLLWPEPSTLQSSPPAEYKAVFALRVCPYPD